MSKSTTYIVSGFVKNKVVSRVYYKLKFALESVEVGDFPRTAKDVQIHSTANGKLNLVNRKLNT
jgi:hypothetical protein